MSFPLSTIERAFQLADTGSVRTLIELERRLRAEGCTSVDGYLRGASVRKQLRERLKAATGA